MAAFKVVTDQNIGTGLYIDSGKLHADPALAPSTVALTSPAGPNLQVNVNGATSTLDLTPLIQAGETNTTLTYAPLTKTLTYTNEDGIPFVIDLSALAADIFVNAASYDPATMVLTLQDNEGTTPDITINLADLKQVITANANGLTWSGTGEASNPLIASLTLDPIAGNLLKLTASGFKVDPADIKVTTDYGLTGDGLATTPISFDASELELHFEDNGNPDNTIVMSNPYRPAGTRVRILDVAAEMWVGYIQGETETYVNLAVPDIITAELTVDIQDLAGNHLAWAKP